MKRIAVAIACGVAVSPLAGAPPGADPPLRVYVTTAAAHAGRDPVEGVKVRRDHARTARRALERELKARHGRNRGSWPAEAESALASLEENEALAEAEYGYRKADPGGLVESARDIEHSFEARSAAGRKERLALASSASEADLVVEVAARRAGKTLPTQVRPDRCYVLFTVAAGARMDPARFTKVPAGYRIKKLGLFTSKIAGPASGRECFTFESYNGGGKEFGCEGAAASAASAAVGEFVEDNYRILVR